MATTQYIGARYVPLFAEPLEWDINKEYEPLTIVYTQGNSYTSRQHVPTGIDISNDTFWALTGNYNAQIEQYRKEVAAFDARIKSNSNAVTSISGDVETIQTQVSGLGTAAKKNYTSSVASGNSDLVTSGAVASAIKSGTDAISNTLGTAAAKDYTDTITRTSTNLITAKGVIDYLGRRKNVILIGDSYADSQGDTSKSRLDVNLPTVATTWDVHSFGDSGSGFTFGGSAGRNFSQQIDYARQNTINYQDVDAIIIAGGRNEAGGQMSQKRPNYNTLKQAAIACFKNARAKFPNAKIYMFACLYDWKLPNFNLLNAEGAIREAARETDVFCSEKAWSLGIGFESSMYFGGTDIHPNQAGSQYIARWIYNAVETGNMNMLRYQYGNTSQTNIAITDQGVQLSGQENMTGTNSVRVLIPFASLPNFLKPKEFNSNDPSTGSGGTFGINSQVTIFTGINNNTASTQAIWFSKDGLVTFNNDRTGDPIRFNVVLPYTLG